MLTPYELYLKIAYHLAQEARAGLNEFKLPREFADQLLDFQAAAVRIAARHLNTRDGVLLGRCCRAGQNFDGHRVGEDFPGRSIMGQPHYLPAESCTDVAEICG